MQKIRATQKEIAQQAGTSASLVSRILSDKIRHISVSEETILRVKRTAMEMGYSPAGRS